MGKPNVMRWDCKTRGCFNECKRPKLGVFADCFGGESNRIAMGDVDGIVEHRGHFLMMEWKPSPSLNVGQRILMEQFTRLSPKCSAIVLCGDTRDMSITYYNVCVGGAFGGWQSASLSDVQKSFARWWNTTLQYTKPGAPQ